MDEGQAFGFEYESADLRASAYWAERFLAASKQRTRSDLESASTEAALGELYGKFVGRQEQLPGPWNRDPFVLDEIGDACWRDAVGVAAFRCADQEDRLVVKDLASGRLEEVRLRPGELDRTIRALCEWLEAHCAPSEAHF